MEVICFLIVVLRINGQHVEFSTLHLPCALVDTIDNVTDSYSCVQCIDIDNVLGKLE